MIFIKVYISGSISNDPDYIEKFSKAENKLASEGHIVFNPAKNHGESYKEYIDMGLFQLMHCEAIYLLEGYSNSTGAALEYHYAKATGMKIMFQ